MFKRVIVWAIVGAAVGNAVSSWLGIKFLNYWFRPPGVTGLDRCVPQINAAMSNLVHAQLIGVAAGFVLFLILGLFWYRRPRSASGGGAAAAR